MSTMVQVLEFKTNYFAVLFLVHKSQVSIQPEVNLCGNLGLCASSRDVSNSKNSTRSCWGEWWGAPWKWVCILLDHLFLFQANQTCCPEHTIPYSLPTTSSDSPACMSPRFASQKYIILQSTLFLLCQCSNIVAPNSNYPQSHNQHPQKHLWPAWHHLEHTGIRTLS